MYVVRRATLTRKFTLPEVVEMPPIGSLVWSNSRGVNISMRGIDLGARPSCPTGFAMVLW